MKIGSLNKNTIILMSFSICAMLLNVQARLIRVDREGTGSVYSTMSAAINAANQANDTIYIQGTDVDTFNETFPTNYNNSKITFMGADTNPDKFPVLTLQNGGWTPFWNNNGDTTRFTRVVLQNCATISLTNNSRKCVIEKTIIRNKSGTVFSLTGDNRNSITISNSIFQNNGTIFSDISSYNNAGPYGTITNCTFYKNSTVNADTNLPNPLGSKLIQISNSIFYQNTTIASAAGVKASYTYNLIPATETGWGTGCIQNNDPKFFNQTSPSLATDFCLLKASPARDKANSTLNFDIAGKSRVSPPDIGAWEWIDMNEAPIRIDIENTIISENAPIRTLIDTLHAIDSNATDKHNYSLVSGNISSFYISGDSLKTNKVFNYELDSIDTIKVRAVDLEGLACTTTIVIKVSDVNEPVTDITLDNNIIAENKPISTLIGQFNSVDQDRFDTHKDSLIGGDTSFFAISLNKLYSKSTFNYEEDSTYSITIRSTDAGGLYLDKVFAIRVSNVNEPPESLYISKTTVPENVALNTVVGTFTTLDRDSGSTFIYSLIPGGVDNSIFTINGNTLRTATQLDYEAPKHQYTIKVKSFDGNDSIIETFYISVTNVNDKPTAINLTDSTMPDSTPVATTVGTLSTTDQDTGETFTYSLPVYGDNAYFKIAGNQLKTDSMLSYLKKPVYSIRIKVKDKADSLTADFNIRILSKPHILTEPVNVIAGELKSASFTITANGTLPIKYQWYTYSTPGVVIDSSQTLTLNNISMLQNGTRYYCNVSNAYGSTSSRTCTLTVYKKPVITTDLNDTVKVISESPCSLSVISGGDSIKYLWIKNSSDTLSVKTSRLIIGSAKAGDSGNYKCLVYNVADTVTSKVSFLKVLVPPSFDTVPDSVIVFEGDTARFRISVSGTPPFVYKWIKNGTDSVGSSAEFEIPAVSISQNNSYYYCRVTNVVKTDSTSRIYLKVKAAPPVIDSQPKSLSIIENQSAVFRVKAHGTAPLQYKWFFINDTTVLSDSSTLILDNVKIVRNGSRLHCRVSNAAATVTSDTVALQVVPERPVIFTHPQSQKTNVAKRVKFTVEATGTPPLQFKWYKSGVQNSSGNLDSLIIDPVKKEDAGEYYCVVSNSSGLDTSDTATLVVDDQLSAPVIISHPESQTKYIGDTVTFIINATGFPLPKYQWILNNSPLASDTSNTLVLRGVSFINNNDSVKCIVYNSEDTVPSNTAVLTITPAPVAGFTASPTGGVVNVSIHFTNNSSGIYTSTIWDFGDGITSTEESPEHIYSKTGLYDVKLIVTGRAGSDTIIKTGLIYVYKKGENPVQISARYLHRNEVEITLSNLDMIEPEVFPPVYDSLGIWISKTSIPENATTSSRIVKYSRSELLNRKTFIDTLALPEAGITWFLMNGLYLTSGKLSVFNEGNGTQVQLVDKNPPLNVLSISGRHLGGDSALITFVTTAPIDTEKVESVVFCYALDSSGLDYNGQYSASFPAKEFLGKSVVEKKVFNDIFSTGSHQIWCGVKLKGKNDSLSTAKTANFITTNSTVLNPVSLSAQAISSSAIRLSWDDISQDSVSKIRIWYGLKQIPLGTMLRSDFSLIELTPSQNSCIVDLLNYSTTYFFAAQVNNKGVWSDITEKSRVNVKTLEPSNSPAVLNTITLHTPRFDTLSASIRISWCLDTTGIGDSLEFGIISSDTGFTQVISGNVQILPFKGLCDSTFLKIQKLTFNKTYYISMLLRKKGGQWALPVENSRKSIETPGFTREPLTFFDPAALFDTVFAFNGNLILSKDTHFGSKDTFNDTVIFYPGKPYNGMVAVGNGFYFAKKSPIPSFWIGLKYTVPSGYSASKVGLYRETVKGLLVEHEFVNDTTRKIISLYTKKTDLPFILLIDTLAPVLAYNSKTDKTALPGKSTADTVTISDNILNMKYQFCYSTGKDPVSIYVDSALSANTQRLILNIPKEFCSVETGIRAELRVNDGVNKVISNLSKQVFIEKVDAKIFPMQWTPFSVSAVLNSTSPESLITHISEVDSNIYDGRYARVFYWCPNETNTGAKDRWIEYNDQSRSFFNLVPGKTLWVKTRSEKSVNLGSALTMSLKDTVKIILPKKEFTDLTLPYNFPIRIKDIIQTSGMDSIGIYKWTNDSGTYVTRGFYIPGKANHQNINDSLDWKYHNAFYSIYNMYNKDITLKIPPVPVSMSTAQPLKKELENAAWGVTINCVINSSPLSEVYCGYAYKAGKIYYPPSPGFSSSRVKLFDRNTNRLYADYITGDLSGGGITHEVAFVNNQPSQADFTFKMVGEGELPSGIYPSLLNTQSGEWETGGKVTVGANSVEYRWIAISGRDFMDKFKNKALSWKYGLRSVYANPIRNAAIFKFTIPVGAKERLKFAIFDAMGRRIWEKTISQPLSSGEHTLIWNGDNTSRSKVSNGMYFVKFSVLDSKGKVFKTFDSRLIYVH